MNLIRKVPEYIKKISKTPGFKTFISVLLAISSGLLVGLIILIIVNPRNAFPAFGGILLGSFGDPISPWIGFGDLLFYATPILLTGLSVGFAFKTGLFNIGASGQFMVAQYVAVLIAITTRNWFLAVLLGVSAGAFWGFFPGFFKATFNVNEVISSIMFNYIGMYLTNMLIKNDLRIFDVSRSETHRIPMSAFNPKLGLDVIFPGSRIDIGIVIAILVAILIYILLNKTTFGYELKAVGYNKNASKYAGINEKRSIIVSMIIAGGLAGLAGCLKILAPGANYLGNTIKPEDVIALEGFNGIPVALLGLSNPIGIIFSGLFITYLQRGGFYIQTLAMLEIINIIIAVIIYFSAFALLFRVIMARWLEKRRKQKLDAKEEADLDGLRVESPRITHTESQNKEIKR